MISVCHVEDAAQLYLLALAHGQVMRRPCVTKS